MRHTKSGTTGWSRARRSVAVAAVAFALVPSGAAFAGGGVNGPSGEGDESPAVVGPLLQILTFGNSVGLPTGCQLGSSTLGAGAAEFGQAQAVSPLIVAINDGCTTVQEQGGAGLTQGQAASQPLSAWNPFVNPVIGQSGDSVAMAGNEYGPALAPFGPTIAGLGGTINFFQGR